MKTFFVIMLYRAVFVVPLRYNTSMNTETVRTSVRYLRAGDVLAASGFVVTHSPWQSVALRSTRKVIVEGFYPGSPAASHVWNRDTTVTIQRQSV